MDLESVLILVDPNSASSTGAVWAEDYKKHKKGDVFGYLASDKRYWRQKISNKQYAVHNLIWIKVNGVFSDDETIDHIDRNGLNNNINNLRLAKRVQQLQNRRGWGKSNFRGVSKYKKNKKYIAYIMYPGHGRIHLGYYNFEQHAAIAHDIAATILFPGNEHYKLNYEKAFWLTQDTCIRTIVVDKLSTFLRNV